MQITTVRLGFEVGSGAPVDIPLAHTFVTGQTQLSGKTTTLRAIVERSQQRAIAFVTKRGEAFEGRRVRPFLPREGDKQIPWRLVETVMAAALGQRNMKWERGAIVTASKGATTLQQVRDNVARLRARTKNVKNEELYMLLGEYLDLVLPEMRSLNAAPTLDLEPGLNVMDLAGVGQQTQAMVIRAALEHINLHERDVLTVFPEAWEFAPRGRSAPAKDDAIAMARKGAVLRNFLLCDSQDLAGVDTVIRQAASVWILGVQRELNELKRTIGMIPAGIKRPKAEDVATLELGQFYACWGRHALKVYVQPAWMTAEDAQHIAMGHTAAASVHRRQRQQEDTVNEKEAEALRAENAQLKEDNLDLRRRLAALERPAAADHVGHTLDGRGQDPARQPGADRTTRDAEAVAGDRAPAAVGALDRNVSTPASVGNGPRAFSPRDTFDTEQLYQAFKTRLIDELPSDPRVLEIVLARPQLRIRVERHVIPVDGRSLRGRIGRLIADDFFSTAKTSAQVLDEVMKRGADRPSNIELGNEMKALCDMGFFTRDNKWYSLVPGMKASVVEEAVPA